jgi:uncharacterized protein
MKRSLLDANVWVALALESHGHHQIAFAWFNSLPENMSACFCRMTQNSFLRLVSSKAIFQEDAMTNENAVKAYRRFRLDPRVAWLDEPLGLESEWLATASLRSSAPKLWMDAYLSTHARLNGARFVTFDRGFSQYQSDGLELVLLAS